MIVGEVPVSVTDAVKFDRVCWGTRATPTSHSTPATFPLLTYLFVTWILFPPSFSPKSTMLSLNPPPMRRLAEVPATGTALSLGRSSTRPL